MKKTVVNILADIHVLRAVFYLLLKEFPERTRKILEDKANLKYFKNLREKYSIKP